MKTKNILKTGLLSLVRLLILGTNLNQVTANSEYEYTNLDITANILIDGTIDVTEDFTANFFVQKHGIIRNIPLNYSVDGNKFHINISDINVSGKKFTTSKSNGAIDIKIGDADRTLIGKQDYPISYSTYGLIRNFSGMGYTELYWNLVGNQFDTNINKVRAELILPKAYYGFSNGDFLIAADGVSNRLEDFEGTLDWSQGDKIILTYDKTIPAGNGITISIKFPNDYFEFDHKKQKKLIGYSKYSGLGQIFNNITTHIREIFIRLILSIPFIASICKNPKWKNTNFRIFKKKKIGKYPVIVQYNPPEGISPSEMSFLYHKGSHPSAISCMIYKRASEGKITIAYEKGFLKGRHITLIKEDNSIDSQGNEIYAPLPGPTEGSTQRVDLLSFENSCWNHLPWKFCTNSENSTQKQTATLPNTNFSKHLISINGAIKNSCKEKGRIILPKNIIFFIIVILMFISGFLGSQLVILFFILTFLIGFCKSQFKLTDEGKRRLAEIYGYKQFLEACEEKQLRTFLEEDPNFVNKILPYATALGLETKLMKMVTPIYEEKGQNISWYSGDLNSISSAMNSISTSSHEYHESSGHSGGSSFGGGGGGGSSGGGGGGGGGSSW